MSKKYLVGSQYFFKNIEGFNPKDIDYLILETNPEDYIINKQISGKNKCIFKWKDMPKGLFLAHSLKKSNCPMEAGKFLIKEFAEHIGLTIEDLKKLTTVFDKIDKKHLYQKIIFDSYIENNSFTLTKEQLMKAYTEYKEARNL